MDIDSFTESTTVIMPQPDADGVIRREAPMSTLVQVEGGTLEGVELAAKIAFTDGYLGNFGVDTNYT